MLTNCWLHNCWFEMLGTQPLMNISWCGLMGTQQWNQQKLCCVVPLFLTQLLCRPVSACKWGGNKLFDEKLAHLKGCQIGRERLFIYSSWEVGATWEVDDSRSAVLGGSGLLDQGQKQIRQKEMAQVVSSKRHIETLLGLRGGRGHPHNTCSNEK